MKSNNPEMIGMKSLKSKGDAYSDGVRSMIKGSSSEKRKIAQKINSIPRMSDENAEKEVVELISNPQLSAIQIQKCLQKAMSRNLSDSNFIRLIQVMIQKHSAIFGTKMNMDIDAELKHKMSVSDLVLQRLRDYKQKEAIKK